MAGSKRSIHTGLLVLGAALVQACSDGATTTSLASSLQPAAELAPTATVNTTVQPGIVLTDGRGQPVQGSEVSFEVTAGGGTVASPVVRTDASGRALGEWTLGRATGTNTIVVRAPGGRSTTFEVRGVADAPVAMVPAVLPPELAPVSGTVDARPAVRVLDEFGNGVPGVAVTFSVGAGGGAISGTAARLTDADGLAAVGGWTLGSQQGDNVLVASSQGLPEVRFTTRALVMTANARLTRFAGDATTCPVGTASCSFSVRVVDAAGSPLAGEVVMWRGADGTSTTTVSNLRGLTTSPNLGANGHIGAFVQSARLVGTGDEVSFAYRIVQSGGFRMDMRFTSDVAPAIRNAFDTARARWEGVITGNLPEVALTGQNQVAANACGINHPAVNEVVDDLLIFVEIVPIDGPGKVLGSAGPCVVRAGNGLPILGVVKLDRDDLDVMERNGTLRDVILHEIGHVLGIGTLWNRLGLLQGAGSADPHYSGQRAFSGFVLGGGTALQGIPVENSGGTGTRDSHWRESVLGNELMTGFINSGGNPLSRITVGSLMDLGYQVDFGAADGFSLLPVGQLPHGGAHTHTAVQLIEVPLPPPIRVW
jgi:hypothetical protein